MPALVLYLLKSNLALVLFYLVYYQVLRKLTFYHLNRLFLVLGIIFSATYPLIDLVELLKQHEELANIHTAYAINIPAWQTVAIPENTVAFDYWLIPCILFWLGCGFMLTRLLMQFLSLYKIHQASVPTSYQGVNFRKVNDIREAFSFWKTIYLDPAKHPLPELESILRHEQIHVNGRHTLDVLLAELTTVFYWFNPGVWLIKRAIKENLEFIADQHVIATGVDSKEYQYLLLKVVGATQPQITNQFNFPSLKRRIAMMNKKQSSLMQIVRYAAIVPLITVPTLILTANSNVQETKEAFVVQTVQEQTGKKGELPEGPLYFIDGVEATKEAADKLDPKDIHGVNVLKGESALEAFGERAANGIVSIVTKKNKDSKEVQEFHKKFPEPPVPPIPGKELPPPPPPVPAKPGTSPPPPAVPEQPGTPPPPPVPSQEHLPPPPPPAKHKGPLIPATGAKLVEDEKSLTYILWPGETTKQEFEVAKDTFRKSGFDLNFDQKYEGDKLVGIKVSLKSTKKGSKSNAVYNTTNLDALKEADNVIVAKADKVTGEVIVGSTIARK